MPLLRTWGLVAGLGSGLVLTLGGPVEADPRPSAKEVAKARQQVRDQAEDLREIEARLDAARARQQELATNAERLVEAYNGERVRLDAARATYQQAALRLGRAEQQYKQARATLAAEVTKSYGEVGVTSPIAAVLAGVGDVSGFLQRASVLSHLSGHQASTVQRLHDIRQVQEILRAQAAQAYAEQVRIADRARQARDAAQQAVDRQLEETRRIEREKKTITQRLDAARSRVDRLKRVRQQLLKRPRRSAAHRIGTSIPAWAARLGSGRGGIAARWALTQLGKPYVWAAAGPSGYDCSGLTMRAWQRAGVSLAHWTGTQWTTGTRVPLRNLRSGDLLFFGRLTGNPSSIHHVGIYIGRGLMVHAPRTGDVVRIASIWRPDLIGATRPG